MKDKYLIVLTTIFAILSCIAIGFGDTTLVPSTVPTLVAWIRYVIALLAIFCIMKKVPDFSQIMRYRIIVVLIVSILTIFHVYKGGVDFLTIVGTIPLMVFSLVSDKIYLESFRLFRKVMILISVIAIIIYIDFTFFHILPSKTVPFYGSEGYYVNYYLSYISLGNDGIRSCGFFNEPGYFGTILALLLLTDKINLRDKGNLFMIIAGITTWSMAFWALLFIGVFLYTLKNWKSRLLALGMIFTFFVVVNSVKFSDPAINSLVERFQYDYSKGSFKGDNRTTDDFNMFFQKFQDSGDVLLGNGTGYYASQKFEHVASYKTSILDWGYVGFFFTYVLLILLAFKAALNNRTAIVFVFCFAISIYQRPNIFAMVYILTLFGGIIAIKDRKISKYHNNEK